MTEIHDAASTAAPPNHFVPPEILEAAKQWSRRDVDGVDVVALPTAGGDWKPIPLAAAVPAEPNVTPPTVAELEQACIDAYAAMVAAHRRLTTAEIRHRDAVKASLQAGRS